MAGQLTIDTLKASSGVLATQNGMTGIAKAWVNYNGVAQTITNSFNVSSVTYISTGSYRVNYTTAMPNATYAILSAASNAPSTAAVVMTCNADSSGNPTAPSTTSCLVFSQARGTGSAIDSAYINVAVLSS
jgi:hypothetical protein